MKNPKKGTQYYHCTLQTSPTKTWRVVGFDQATHNQCQLYEKKTGNPVKLLNVREENDQHLVNQTTTLHQMSNSDVTFTSTLPSSSSDCGAQSSSTVASSNISLKQLPTLTRNQKVNVTGVLTLGQKPPKQVTKRNGQNGKVKENCIIEDATGNAVIHIWDELIEKVENSKSYTLKNLSAKKLLRQHHVGNYSIHNL